MTNVEKWMAAGAKTEAEATMLAAMYGAPKAPSATDAFLEAWNIHPDTWSRVVCKANVKKIVKLFAEQIEHIYVSPAFGSVYINLKDETTIRVSNHERTSAEHAKPDFNVYDKASLEQAIAAK